MADHALTGSSTTPGLDRLEAQFRAASPVFRDTVSRLRAELGDDWARVLDTTVTRIFSSDIALSAAVEGYSRFSLEVVRLQIRFEKELEYAHKSYAEVTKDIYANEAYMMSCYLPGLLLSHYLWPHHYRQRRFFEHAFVADMVRAGARRFYDVGVGTGFYSRLALTAVTGIQGQGFDISPWSKAFAERHVAAFGAANRYRVELRNVVVHPPEPIDWLICVEVLEHLENPIEFLSALRIMLRPGGKAFITAALNAPNADHIYLYRTSEEVKVQLAEAGFAIEQYFGGLAAKPRAKGTPVAEVAAFLVT